MSELLPTIITCFGSVTLLLISSVAFFIIGVIKEVRRNSVDLARLSVLIATHKQEYVGDIKLLTRETELQIQQVNKNVGDLTNMVKTVFEHYVNKD